MGYGFVEVTKDEADVFLHIKIMGNFRIYYLNEGQNLSLKIIEHGCQPQASEGYPLKFTS